MTPTEQLLTAAELPSSITRAHVMRGETTSRGAISAVFEYLYEGNAVSHNPGKGVNRPNQNMQSKCLRTDHPLIQPARGSPRALAVANAGQIGTIRSAISRVERR